MKRREFLFAGAVIGAYVSLGPLFKLVLNRQSSAVQASDLIEHPLLSSELKKMGYPGRSLLLQVACLRTDSPAVSQPTLEFLVDFQDLNGLRKSLFDGQYVATYLNSEKFFDSFSSASKFINVHYTDLSSNSELIINDLNFLRFAHQTIFYDITKNELIDPLERFKMTSQSIDVGELDPLHQHANFLDELYDLVYGELCVARLALKRSEKFNRLKSKILNNSVRSEKDRATLNQVILAAGASLARESPEFFSELSESPICKDSFNQDGAFMSMCKASAIRTASVA